MIKPQDINAPHVTVEQRSDGELWIHVRADKGEATRKLLYHETVRCMFVVTKTHVSILGTQSSTPNQPRLPKTLATNDRARCRLINEYLRQAAGDFAFWRF